MLNKVILMGRLVADPELRKTQSDISVCRFRIAVNRPYQKDKEQEADFISCIAWRGAADFVQRYFTKGRMIIVEGALRNNNYTDGSGIRHYSMDVHVENVGFGESKGNGEQSSSSLPPMPTPVPQQQASPKITQDELSLGDMSDFEEILSDGDVPF